MKERIDWEAYKANVKVAIKNEELWAVGCTDDYNPHEENIGNLNQELEWLEEGNYNAVLDRYNHDESLFKPYLKKEKAKMWETVASIKNGLVREIVNTIGEQTIDLSEERVKVFAIEHRCNEGLDGILGTISADGFTLDYDCELISWKDMIVEDLAMVYNYLTTGRW